MIARLLVSTALVIAAPAAAQTCREPVRQAVHAAVSGARFPAHQGCRLSCPRSRRGWRSSCAEIAAIAEQPGGADVRQYDRRRWSGRGGCSTGRARCSSALSGRRIPTMRCRRSRPTHAQAAAQHGDAIMLNAKLFARVKTLHDKRAALKLTPEQAQLLRVTYQQFVQCGRATERRRTRPSCRRSTRASRRCRPPSSRSCSPRPRRARWCVDDMQKLAGLGADGIAAAAKAAADRGMTGKWVLPLQNTTQQPALASLTDRATREALFEKSWTRTEQGDANDTRATIAELAQLRAQKAKLLGFPTYARLRADRPDGEDAAGGDGFPQAVRRPRCRPSSASEAAEIKRRSRRPAAISTVKPVGLGFLFGAGAQGQVRPRWRCAEAVFRDQQRADRRRVLCRQPAVRHHLQGAEGPAGLQSGHARVRGVRGERQDDRR